MLTRYLQQMRFVLAVVCLLTWTAPAAFAQVGEQQKWASDVWSSATRGDLDALERHFKAIPEDLANHDSVARFRESYAQHIANAEKAKTQREEDRLAAAEELHKHVEAGDLSKALRAAVTIQTLSDNLDAAFDDHDITKIIAWAKERIPAVKDEGDWLLAQELLYYLRTLYEDTSRSEDYREYRQELDAVNRRVSLLAQYAPQKLHELRSKRAERLGEKPLPPYRPTEVAGWQERTADITPPMLKSSLATASREHIDSRGWRPLLVGGLTELRLLATTPNLEETFPTLGNQKLVDQWVAHIDNELKFIEQTKNEKDLDSLTLSGVLDELMRVNERTIQLPRGVIYREFGDGATYELDEFSEIIWPDKLPRFKQATEGAFVGVGILIRHNETQEIVVVNPLEGTPAYFGGVKPNDLIVEVDGQSTVGWSLNEAVDHITGAPNTEVTLGLKREGVDDLIPLTLKRDVIKLRSVMGWYKQTLREDGSPEWDWYIDPDSRIAYIKLSQFTEESYDDLKRAWREISANGKPAGLILDLRYNPGGLLTSAVQISNLFVRNGVIVTGEDKDGKPAWRDQRADPSQARIAAAEVPTVVLINQGSASASEIVAGCLQAHGAAVVLGERSFGKGSVQTVHSTSENARIKLTTQYYRLPPKSGETKGRLVHKQIGATVWGVDPDIEVKMTPQQVEAAIELRQEADIIPQNENGELDPDPSKRPNIRRLLTEGLDPQLEKALLILQAKAMDRRAKEDTRRASR